MDPDTNAEATPIANPGPSVPHEWQSLVWKITERIAEPLADGENPAAYASRQLVLTELRDLLPEIAKAVNHTLARVVG